jgi:hypothetical protein
MRKIHYLVRVFSKNALVKKNFLDTGKSVVSVY